MTTLILGADPGVTSGFCLIGSDGFTPLAFQCSHEAAYALAAFLLEASDGPATVFGAGEATVHAAGERFVPGRGPGARQSGAAVTRQLIEDLGSLHDWKWRSAGEVKPWATDDRLRAAGLLAACHGMPHAADAMRHALFFACRDLGWPDPLSRAGRQLRVRNLTPGEL